MKLAIVGATGLVGKMMLKVLNERKIPISELHLFASSNSAGTSITFRDKKHIIKILSESSMTIKYDYILMSAGSTIAKNYAPIASKFNNTIIDNSSAFRRDSSIPLVIPEVNYESLRNYNGIIANPNCSTIQMVLSLHNLHKKYRLTKIIVSTYQAVSGAGKQAIDSLKNEYKKNDDLNVFSHKISSNVIPQIGNLRKDHYSEEEEKMRFETKKILEDESIQVSATTVRVPVIHGHSEMVYAEFKKVIDLVEAKEILRNSDSIVFHNNEIVTPLDVTNSNNSHISRLRYGVDNRSLTFWNVAHNLRVGAATNAVRIMEKLIELRKNKC